MPLITQQDVVTVFALGGGEKKAIELLKTLLDSYPDVRIVSIAVKDQLNPLGKGALGTSLTAVIESV
jgi:hypothetical protein